MIYWIAIIWTLIAAIQNYKFLKGVENDEKFNAIVDNHPIIPRWVIFTMLYVVSFADRFLLWWYYIWLFNIKLPIQMRLYFWCLKKFLAAESPEQRKFYLSLSIKLHPNIKLDS